MENNMEKVTDGLEQHVNQSDKDNHVVDMSFYDYEVETLESYVNRYNCTLGNYADALQEMFNTIANAKRYELIDDDSLKKANLKFRDMFEQNLFIIQENTVSSNVVSSNVDIVIDNGNGNESGSQSSVETGDKYD